MRWHLCSQGAEGTGMPSSTWPSPPDTISAYHSWSPTGLHREEGRRSREGGFQLQL